MGKKKFIDKKQAATFQLIARDTSDPNYDDRTPGGDKVFVRVDNSQYAVDDFFTEEENSGVGDSDSIFEDADEGGFGYGGGIEGRGALPEHVRKEILELGFPDDGYNYLTHLREIKNAGGGSAFYQNPKATVEPLPLDAKAYDASRVAVPRTLVEETRDEVIYSVAEKSVGVRLKKVIDLEVAKLLDDDDNMSRFASDEEDLEEDFVVRANLADGASEENDREESVSVHGSVANGAVWEELKPSGSSSGMGQHVAKFRKFGDARNLMTGGDVSDDEQKRVRRLLDDQFELLERQEYGSDDDDIDDYYGGPECEEVEDLAGRLNQVLKDRLVEDVELGDHYKAPADLLKDKELPEEIVKNASDLLRRCTEYAEKYENEDDNENIVFVEESSDESEVWDCDTIVTTYSNLDNHPGKIEAPRKEPLRKVADAVKNPDNVIALQGRKGIPLCHLPHGKKVTSEKVNVADHTEAEPLRRKNVGQETKEEKKKRKDAIKKDRKEARHVKKELKGLYKSETQRGQKAVAVSGPSTIHLM